MQILLEQAVEGRGDRDADLRQAHGQAAGYERADSERRTLDRGTAGR
jgi:hypothetical protein